MLCRRPRQNWYAFSLFSNTITFLKPIFLPFTDFAVIMADLRSKLQPVLKSVEDFLKKGTGELTEETDKRLVTLREMSEILASIIAMKGQVKAEAFQGNHCIVLIVGLCDILLFGLYIECLTQLSNRSNMVNEMESKQKEDESSALPKFMQVKYDQVKSYLEKAEGQLKKIDEMLSELLPKVRVYYLLHAAFLPVSLP